MFRYGGPIKEGLMHGMKNGGSMSNNQGPRRAALVGNPIYPQTGGREHHVLPYLIGQGIYAAGRALARPFGSWALKKFGPGVARTATGPTKNAWGILTGQGSKEIAKQGPTFQKNVFTPNWLGRQFQKDPLAGAAMTGKGFVGGALKKGLGVGKYAFGTPSGLLFMGLPVTYAAGKYFLSDGTELNDDQIKQIKQEGPPGGGETALGSKEAYYEKPPVTKTPEELAAEAKAARTKKLNKYLDTMGYDKAKKTAMGDALIDASAIVQDATTEAGSLKKADWGKMINKAIQTTSKRLDKPDQIREAVGLMLTKSEIEKDLEDPQVKKIRALEIKKGEKALAGLSTSEILQQRMLKGDYPTGKNLARTVSINNPGLNIKVIPSTGIKPDKDTIEYITEIVEANQEKGTPFPAGVYVIKDRIIQVDETGTVTPIPISALE